MSKPSAKPDAAPKGAGAKPGGGKAAPAGKGVPAAAVERAVALSHEKYCSATIMLAKTAEVTTSFEVVQG